MSNKKDELFALNKKLQELADSVTNDLKWINAPKGHYIAMAFGKGYKTFSAILLLCQNGYGQDAQILARSLFELTVNTLYIFSDSTDGRVNRYFVYQSVLRKKAIGYYLNDEKRTEMLINKFKEKNNGETIESVQKLAQGALTKYKYTNNRWSEHNLSVMSKEVGLEHL